MVKLITFWKKLTGPPPPPPPPPSAPPPPDKTIINRAPITAPVKASVFSCKKPLPQNTTDVNKLFHCKAPIGEAWIPFQFTISSKKNVKRLRKTVEAGR